MVAERRCRLSELTAGVVPAMSLLPRWVSRLTSLHIVIVLLLVASLLYFLRNYRNVTEAKVEFDWDQLGTMAIADGARWSFLSCNTSQALRRVDLPTQFGLLSIYVYGSASLDLSVTARALRGEIFERREITRFLQLTSDLPLIDVGANVGLVALQAALQGRQVVALEPVPDNAVRLCRAAKDFGHSRLLSVIQNAISDSQGPVTLAMDQPRQSTHFTLLKLGRFSPTSAYAIKLDRILDILPFHSAALKIDVEGYEGHVLSGADRLFQQVDIPVVWLEWEHVKKLPEFGARTILDFMHKHKMMPRDIMSGAILDESSWHDWPFTVLWKREVTGRNSTRSLQVNLSTALASHG